MSEPEQKQSNPPGGCHGGLDSFVDMTYYINLDASVDRKNALLANLEKAGIAEYTRMPAVLVNYEDVPFTHGILGPFKPRVDKKKYVAGKWGCRLSHLHILQDALAKGYKQIAIFEDDVVLPENFSNAFASVQQELSRLQNEFCIAYLSLLDPQTYRPSDAFPGCSRIQLVKTRAYGAYAYIVRNRDGSLFQTLIDQILARPIEIDLLYANLIDSGSLKNGCFVATPQLAWRSNTLPSTIQCAPDTWTLDQFVNMTYFINFDHDVARRQRIEAQFSALGIRNYRRMTKKTTAAKADDQLLYDVPDSVHALPGPEKKRFLLDLLASRSAHVECLKDAEANSFHTIAVFDDDCCLVDFHNSFHHFAKDLHSMGDDFEVAYFNLSPKAITQPIPKAIPEPTENGKARPHGFMTLPAATTRAVIKNALGSEAYVVNNRQGWVLRHIVKNVEFTGRHFYGCLNQMIEHHHLTRCFVLAPPLVQRF